MSRVALTGVLLAAALVVPSVAARAQDYPHQTLLAKAKKETKKKKKKKDEGEAFGPDDIGEAPNDDNGVGVHREQAGVDHPYGTEFTGTTTLSLNSVKTGDSSATSQTLISIGGEFYFILGHLEIGPQIEVDSETSQRDETTIDPITGKSSTATVDVKELSYTVGPIVKWNFGNIDHDALVPFAYGGVAYLASSSKVGDADEAKATGLAIRAGGGINMFLSDHLAFVPKLEYRTQDSKGDGDNAVKTTVSGFRIIIGIGTFL